MLGFRGHRHVVQGTKGHRFANTPISDRSQQKRQNAGLVWSSPRADGMGRCSRSAVLLYRAAVFHILDKYSAIEYCEYGEYKIEQYMLAISGAIEHHFNGGP